VGVTQAGRAELVGGPGQNAEGRLGVLLEKWGSLLQRFLKNEDDQVRTRAHALTQKSPAQFGFPHVFQFFWLELSCITIPIHQ
jgi:hypothetical protein